jgi:LPS-assembly protein
VAILIRSPALKKGKIMGTLQLTSFLRLFLSVPLVITLSSAASGQDNPIGFVADNVVVKQNDGSLFATGNVELKQGKNTLRADEVTYYREQNKAIARGDVIHRDAAGTVTRANVMELDTEFSHILAETIISKFANGDWMAADNADRVTGDKGVFENSRFTPCNCDFINGEQPMWNIKASRTVHNERTKTITHYNMRMDVMNVPIGYLPFLSHPDWTVRRRSGFLTPSFSLSSDLGFSPAVPYYHVIDKTSDLEITTQKYQYRGFGVKTRHRKLWDNSQLITNIYSANVETYKKKRELVGAVDSHFSSQIGNGWNVNANLRRASQDTFMRRYGFNQDTSLKSSISATRTIGNRYYLVEASDRQSMLTTDKTTNEQTILPYIFYEKEGKGWRQNQWLRTEISALQLDNDQGHDLARWSGVFELSEEFQIPLGVTSYQGNLTGNYYSLHEKPTAATSRLGDYSFLTPALSVGWRLPIAMTSMSRTAIFEPQVKAVYVGGADHTGKIPNRDSNDYRIDEANLFLLNRYQGKDYVLPGTRVDAGISATIKDNSLGDLSGFLGLSRRLSGAVSSGLNTDQGDKYSDYVASMSLDPKNGFNLRWSGRLSSKDLTLNESQTSLSAEIGSSQISLTHNQLAKAYFADSDDDREELSSTYSQSFSGGWNFSATQLWDLSYGKTAREKSTASLTWNGGIQDCVYARIYYEHDPVGDRDIDGVDQLNLVVGFSQLGTLTQSVMSSLSE